MYSVYSSSVESCSSQNIKPESSSTINDQQNNEILIEGQNEDNLPETSKTTDRICDKITIKDSAQDSQINKTEPLKTELLKTESLKIEPLKTEPLKTEPMSSQLKDEKNEDQLSTSEMNIKSNVFVPFVKKQKKNMDDMFQGIARAFLTKKEKKKLLQSTMNPENIYNAASVLMQWATSFNARHILHATDVLQRRISNRTIKPKHLRTFYQLLQLEEQHQKKVKASYKYWNE